MFSDALKILPNFLYPALFIVEDFILMKKSFDIVGKDIEALSVKSSGRFQS